MNKLIDLGDFTLKLLMGLGNYFLFVLELFRHSFSLLKRPFLGIKALYFTGVLSLPIILFAGFFVGMVLALQGYNTLIQFGAEQSLGIMVALSLMRELGSVVSALLFAGRAGSALTAEIALMKTTEQLTALEMMGIYPSAYVGVPKFWGAFFALPILTALFVSVAILGAYLVGVVHLGVDGAIFWNQMQQKVDFYDDLIQGMVFKSLAFGAIIASISVFQGFSARPTAEGMGEATTRTVVLSSLATLGFDFILTAMMFGD